MSAPITGIGCQLLIKGIDRFSKLVEAEIRQTQIEINFRILRRALKNCLKGLDGLLELQLGLIDNAEPLEDFRLVGIIMCRLLVDRLRCRKILLFLELSGPLEVVVQTSRALG